MTRLSRRDVLQRLAFGGLTVGLSLFTEARPAADVSQALAWRLSRFFVARQSAQVLGRRYLDRQPHEANLGLLTARISRTAENYVRLASADMEQLRALLSTQMRQDFEDNLTVSIDGWILSETEARLCAIAAIT